MKLIHIAIVSDQALANLIPALIEKPDKAYLVATEEIETKGLPRRLKGVLQAKGIEAEIIRGAPDAGLESILEFAKSKVAARLRKVHPTAEIVLNATGGTKLMVLGFVEVFRDLGARIIYTDTAHRRIETLPIPGQAHGSSMPMVDVLDVETYLEAQGFRIHSARSDDPQWTEAAEKRRAAAEFLAERMRQRSVQKLIGALNGLASKALDKRGRKLVAPKQVFDFEPPPPWLELLDELQRFRVLRWQGRNLEFPDADCARFLHGDWLEEYAWHVLHDERPFDVRLGVTGRWDAAQAANNEFDVLATRMNQLLFIECKTLRLGDEDARDADLLYKVDSLGQDVRGIFGTTWILSAREPTQVMMDRAKQQRVRLFGPTEIVALRGHVRNWLDTKSASG
jgi:hypothetical protein